MKNKTRDTLLKIYKLLFERFGPQDWWPGETRIEVIIGAILTQNTSWSNVEKAIKNLKRGRLLNIKSLECASLKTLASLIRPAGYFNVKAKRLKNFIEFLKISYASSLDKMFREETELLRARLLEVKGIGPETADSILLYAGERPVFVVDAYTRRIFSRQGLINKSDTYEEIQRFFMENLPEDSVLFNEYHALIVELGKNICRIKKPGCKECPIRRVKNG